LQLNISYLTSHVSNIKGYAGINPATASGNKQAERQTSEKEKYPVPFGWGLND
jgi:hypothetical protein